MATACLVVMSLGWSGPAPTGSADPPASACRAGTPAGGELLGNVGPLIDQYLAAHRSTFSALSVAVVSPGRRAVLYCGTTAVGSPVPVDATTVYEIGSETKLFTAAAFAALVVAHSVGMDDPLNRYFDGTLPGGVCAGGPPTPITLRMLATHNAGLPDDPRNTTWVTDRQGRAGYTRADLQASFTSGFQRPCDALLSTPGTRYAYSDWGFALLGATMADHYAPGQAVPPFGQLVRTLVTGPLGMNSTVLEPNPVSPAEATPTCPPPGPRQLPGPCYWDNVNAFAGGGGLVSTIGDMATFVEASLSLRAATAVTPALRMMQQPAGFGPACAATPTCQGLAWSLTPPGPGSPSPVFPTLEKNGGTNGFTSNTFIAPRACWGITFLTNSGSLVTVAERGPNGLVDPVLARTRPATSLCPG